MGDMVHDYDLPSSNGNGVLRMLDAFGAMERAFRVTIDRIEIEVITTMGLELTMRRRMSRLHFTLIL